MPRGRLGLGGLGVAGLVEADRERVQPRLRALHHQAHDGGGIEPAREEGADRHVGQHMGADRVVEAAAQLGDELLVRGRGPRIGGNRPEVPGGADGEPPSLPGRAFPGAEGEDALVDRSRRRHGEPRKVVADRGGIDLGGEGAAGQESGDLRGEAQPLPVLAVVERLDAEGVPGQEQPFVRGIPDRKGEHPAQASQAVLAPLGVRGEQDLRVALGVERPAGGAQLGPQLAEIVDRAVEDQAETPVRGAHGLVAVRRVENRQSAHPEGGLAFRLQAAVVGTAMEHGGAHPLHLGGALGCGGVRINVSCYAAHG